MSTEKDKKEALKLIDENIKAIGALMLECETLAEKNEVYFSFNPLDIYGMGGSYIPKTVYIKDYAEDLSPEDIEEIMQAESDDDYPVRWGWKASSTTC
jgi:hypothetical protein